MKTMANNAPVRPTSVRFIEHHPLFDAPFLEVLVVRVSGSNDGPANFLLSMNLSPMSRRVGSFEFTGSNVVA
jgi:hypothetical protein